MKHQIINTKSNKPHWLCDGEDGIESVGEQEVREFLSENIDEIEEALVSAGLIVYPKNIADIDYPTLELAKLMIAKLDIAELISAWNTYSESWTSPAGVAPIWKISESV